MADPANTGGNTISAEVAARLIRVSERRLRQLVSEGWIGRAAHGRYTVVAVVHGYLAYRDDLDQRRAAAAIANRSPTDPPETLGAAPA